MLAAQEGPQAVDGNVRGALHQPRDETGDHWRSETVAPQIERAFVRVMDGEGALTARDSAVGFYLLGRLLQDEWRDWRSFGHLRGLSTGRWNCPAFSLERDAAAIPVEKPGPVDINIECPALFESIMDSDFMSDAEHKSHARVGLERWFHRAIEADSSYWPAYRAILSELAFEGRWRDLERLAQAAAKVFRDDYRPRLLLGLAAYRQERYAQASALFDTALGAMPDEVAVLFRQPTQVLSVAALGNRRDGRRPCAGTLVQRGGRAPRP